MAAGNSVKATLIDKDSSVDITKTWLIWQCQMVAGVIQGAIISADGEGVIRCLSSWPEDRERHPRLLTLGEEVLSTGDAIIRPKEKSVETNMGAYDLIGCPLNSGEDIVGAVVLMVSSRSDPQLHAIQQLLQWGGVWV
ncbi:MAG: hypothetical protein OEZ23_04740, partial [Gammaproteobacteria bacterium]|nr:hypothetical protein [Gammaproteobacteria bacterium]